MGAFKLISESDELSKITPGSLFLKRKDTKDAMKGIRVALRFNNSF